MDTIYEDPEEQGIGLKGNWLSSLRRRFQQSTISVQDCSLFVYCILGTVILSYSFLSDSILDIFYYVSHESEAIATAYVEFLIFVSNRPKFLRISSMHSRSLVDWWLIVFMGVFQSWFGPIWHIQYVFPYRFLLFPLHLRYFILSSL